jgi:hypothetical protein
MWQEGATFAAWATGPDHLAAQLSDALSRLLVYWHKQKVRVAPTCHCEERSDEAISGQLPTLVEIASSLRSSQ